MQFRSSLVSGYGVAGILSEALAVILSGFGGLPSDAAQSHASCGLDWRHFALI